MSPITVVRSWRYGGPMMHPNPRNVDLLLVVTTLLVANALALYYLVW